MGYCGSRWISIYNHARSIEHPMLSPSTVCEDQFWKEDWREYDPWWWLKHPFRVREDIPIEQWVDPRESVISVIGVMQVGGHFEPRSVTRARAVPGNEAATSTGAYVELLDDDGTRIAAGALLRLPSHGHGCGGGCGGGCSEDDGPALVQAFIPTSARGSQLRLTTKDGEAWSMRAPEKPIAPARVDVDVRDQTLALRWAVDERHADCEVWIRCATGKGEPRVIWVAKGAGEVVLEFGVLPPGPARIDVVCHDGFDAVSGEPVEIEIPARAPQAAILYPTPGRTLLAGRPLRLHGLGTACDGSLVEAKACRWLLDGKVVSEGRDVWTEAPPAGKHELTFEVRDRHGSSRASCRFETVEVPRAED